MWRDGGNAEARQQEDEDSLRPTAKIVTQGQRLKPDKQRQFRSGLGLALYVAQDRPHVQQALWRLAAYMAAGTTQAMKAQRHLGSYLKNMQELGILLPEAEESMLICDVWKKVEDWEQRRGRALYKVETFAHAHWMQSELLHDLCEWMLG